MTRHTPPDLRVGRIRGIVFDLDGTLVDSYEAIADSLNHARARRDLSPLSLELVRSQVGHGLERLIEQWVGPDCIEDGVRDFRQRYAQVFRDKTRALDDVPETLRRLAGRGYRMSVASNKPARFGGPILDALGLREHFDAVLGPDVSGVTKPDPAMLLQSMARMGCGREASVYVGDMVLDVETAARAGVPVVLVAGGSSPPDALRATGRAVLARFAELETLLSPSPR